MNALLKNKFVLIGILAAVFGITFVMSRSGGPGDPLAYLGVSFGGEELGAGQGTVTPDSGGKDDMVSPKVTPVTGDMTPVVTPVTSHNTSGSISNKTEVTPVTSVSPVTSDTPAVAQVSLVTPSPTPSVILSPLPSHTPAPAAGAGEIVINEIGWMGTEASATDEWLELYNVTDRQISLEGWHVTAADGSPNIVLKGTIGPHVYYLVERTDDSTISDISADLTTAFGKNGSIGNNGEKLSLVSSVGSVIDEVSAEDGWFAGDNSTKASMERVSPLRSGNDPGNWATNDSVHINGHDSVGNLIIGTPRAVNSVQ
ncbi:MAG TPA: lamin tail domain-containing protein [Candidatus Paceibacterota bacterium]|nr:lamin tail domain-containing protein [Candidatus Paceibacterota bacterium]